MVMQFPQSLNVHLEAKFPDADEDTMPMRIHCALPSKADQSNKMMPAVPRRGLGDPRCHSILPFPRRGAVTFIRYPHRHIAVLRGGRVIINMRNRYD